MARGSETRARIMDVAQDSVLTKGFDATSIEEIVAGAEITKSGFFYHFPDKNALAHALIERHIETEDQIFDEIFARAGELADDPLQAMLVGLKLLAELLAKPPRRRRVRSGGPHRRRHRDRRHAPGAGECVDQRQ